MKTILAILILACVLNSCKKEDPFSHKVIDGSVGIIVKDKAGMDLLNPSNPGAIRESNINVSYLINGEVNQPTAEDKHFFIGDETEYNGKFWMVVFLNMSPDEAYPVTYIKWNENDTDTLKCDVYRAPGIISVKNIWLNDSLVWKSEDYAKEDRNIEIIK